MKRMKAISIRHVIDGKNVMTAVAEMIAIKEAEKLKERHQKGGTS